MLRRRRRSSPLVERKVGVAFGLFETVDLVLGLAVGDLLSAAMSSPMALVVAVTKRRDTADLDMDLERCSRSAPTGSATSAWRRVASPASIRSTPRELSKS